MPFQLNAPNPPIKEGILDRRQRLSGRFRTIDIRIDCDVLCEIEKEIPQHLKEMRKGGQSVAL